MINTDEIFLTMDYVDFLAYKYLTPFLLAFLLLYFGLKWITRDRR